jgi:redox-sensitive bicupin YhaK (pirin superfamily)
VSGPVSTEDAVPLAAVAPGAVRPVLELTSARATRVGSLPVRRLLPRRARRTVGSWCFADHAGPVGGARPGELGIGPHPHMGLQTVTWLVHGELVHLDSLGSEQPIRPGQLNLMTAGRGVAHAEEDGGHGAGLHAVQLWVAQPETTRNGPAAFEHHATLPRAELDRATVTVLVGELAGAVSPARRDSGHMGAELLLRPPGVVLPLRPDYEYALMSIEGTFLVGGSAGAAVEPGTLAYLGQGRDECGLAVAQPARALLLGGVPFPEPLFMWWNFVARNRHEVSEARRQWAEGAARFGTVRSALERIEVGRPPWE